MQKPRWFKRVFRAVGLTGDGETGAHGAGDREARGVVGPVAGRASASFGLAARASIVKRFDRRSDR